MVVIQVFLAMKIILLEFRDPWHPLAGGAEHLLREIYTRIVRWGYSVDYLCCAHPGAPACEEREGIRYIRIGGTETLFALQAHEWVRRQAQSGGYDLVVEGLDKLPFLTPLCCQLPVGVMVPHLFGEAIFREASFPVACGVRLAEYLIPWVYRSARFSALCESTKEDLVSRGIRAKQITVIEPGLTPPAPPASVSVSGRQPYLLYVGRLRHYKGIRTAMDALVRLQEMQIEIGLVIVGDGPDRADLEHYAQASIAAGKIHFVGKVSEEEKSAWLAGAEALLYPSCKEGWGLTVLEANSFGVPAIVSRVAGLKDSVQEGRNGLLHEWGDAADLAECVRRLLQDAELKKKLSRGAVEWAGRFTWDKTAQKTLAWLEAVVGDGSN